ncbi:hypothetical protein Vadar_034040 [Vaccinium darrowii]|uniref:Uncharacterized protein n=1 Tax=Vaccinium darrowii TaxID=229202 RepID=A0ACB7X6W8_9ERIC|nr:hypothetical protein Vadar_034040 [Vaccinium darrowii]
MPTTKRQEEHTGSIGFRVAPFPRAYQKHQKPSTGHRSPTLTKTWKGSTILDYSAENSKRNDMANQIPFDTITSFDQEKKKNTITSASSGSSLTRSGPIAFASSRCDSCKIRLEDPNAAGEDLFAAYFVYSGYRENSVEPILNSSRYFVLKIKYQTSN